MLYEQYKDDLQKLYTDPMYIKTLCSKINATEPKNAKVVYEQLRIVLQKKELKQAFAWATHHYGWVHYDLGEFKVALELFSEAHEQFLQTQIVEGQLSSITALVVCHGLMHNFVEASEFGLKGITLATETGNYERLQSIQSNLAVVYVEMGEFEQAKTLLEQMVDVVNLSTTENEISNLANLSECERQLGNFDESTRHIERALMLAKQYHHNILPAIYDHLGRVLTSLQKVEDAEKMFQLSVKIATERECTLYLNDALLHWAELDILCERYELALEKLDKVQQRFQAHAINGRSLKLYELYHQAYHGIHNYSAAYENLRTFHTFEKDILEKRNSTSIQILDFKYKKESNTAYKFLYKQMQNLYRVGQRITSALRKDDIIEIMTSEIPTFIKTDAVQICIYNSEKDEFEYPLVIEHGVRIHMDPSPLSDESFSAYCFRTQREILINDFYEEHDKYISNMASYFTRLKNEQVSEVNKYPESTIFVPIIVQGKVIGVMSTQSFEKHAYKPEDVINLKILSTYLGIALENARLYEQLERRASYDSLTGLLNRAEAFEAIGQLIHTQNPQHPIYVMMIDVDNYKLINDTYGHQKGDEVLQKIASTIHSSVRKCDVVGRYGGEEFIVVINAGEDMVFDIAERMRKNIEEFRFFNEEEQKIEVTASIGVAQYHINIQQAIRDADLALYEAKNTGKNKIIVYFYKE
ncbi:MAG: diguanylate cyclase [Bacilli bacterium]